MALLLEKRLKRLSGKKGRKISADEFKRLARMKNIKFVKLANAKWCKGSAATKEITLDGESLNPISGRHFSPFMATARLPRNIEQFWEHQGIRHSAALSWWSQINKLLIHLDRKQWKLFDKQFNELEINLPTGTEIRRIFAAFKALEFYGGFFSPPTNTDRQRIKQRITLADNISPSLLKNLEMFFRSKKKDDSIHRELWSIRDRWSRLHSFLAPIYNVFYWDEKAHTLDDFTLAQKRFDELKPFYVDCFETFCRISVTRFPKNKRFNGQQRFPANHTSNKSRLRLS